MAQTRRNHYRLHGRAQHYTCSRHVGIRPCPKQASRGDDCSQHRLCGLRDCSSTPGTIRSYRNVAVDNRVQLWAFARIRLRRALQRSRLAAKRHPARSSFL